MTRQGEGEGKQKDGSRKKRKVNISLFKAYEYKKIYIINNDKKEKRKDREGNAKK